MLMRQKVLGLERFALVSIIEQLILDLDVRVVFYMRNPVFTIVTLRHHRLMMIVLHIVHIQAHFLGVGLRKHKHLDWTSVRHLAPIQTFGATFRALSSQEFPGACRLYVLIGVLTRVESLLGLVGAAEFVCGGSIVAVVKVFTVRVGCGVIVAVFVVVGAVQRAVLVVCAMPVIVGVVVVIVVLLHHVAVRCRAVLVVEAILVVVVAFVLVLVVYEVFERAHVVHVLLMLLLWTGFKNISKKIQNLIGF